MQWFFTEEGKEIEVPIEKWIWGVVYSDGTELKQFDANGRFHQFKEIELDRVILFVMVNVETEQRYDLVITPEVEPFHMYRNVVLNAATPGEQRVRIYCFGYKHKGAEKYLYNFIMPDGHLVSSPVRNVRHEIMGLSV